MKLDFSVYLDHEFDLDSRPLSDEATPDRRRRKWDQARGNEELVQAMFHSWKHDELVWGLTNWNKIFTHWVSIPNIFI